MSLLPREILIEFDEFDLGVVGEGEETLVELLRALAAGSSAAGVAGVVHRGPQGPAINDPRPVPGDLDALGLPADWAQFYCAIPMPGTQLRKEATEEGYLTTNDFARMELNQALLSTPWLSVNQLRHYRRLAYLRSHRRGQPFDCAEMPASNHMPSS